MNVRLKRAKELMGYAVQLTKDEGLPTMVKRGAGFVRRRFFGKRARYLPGKKVLEAQAAEMAGKTAENCGLPTISILTPLYNTPENYLREFLDSFVNQTAPNGQLCLADASDDAHPEVERVVREYQRKNQRIVYKKVENKGIAANTNAAETLATGEYLALADHDDVLAPHAMYAMGKAVLQLREKGEPDGFLYSDEALFTKDIKKPMVGHFKPDYAPDYLLCCNYICHLAVFKRALYEQLGGERPECDGSQDHDLFLRLIEQTGGAAHLPQVLYYWRVHAGSTSGGTDAKPYVAAAAKKALTDHLSRTGRTGTVCGSDTLSFFDAAAPIVSFDSIDQERVFFAARYGRGEDDYINCPFNKEEYEAFYDALIHAESAPLKEFDKRDFTVYEGCMPVEVMAKRGPDTLRFGPMKPVGLTDPRTGRRPWAVVQLRRENAEGTMFNLVGFQTNLKFPEQKRVFSMIPGLENASFLRYGVMHRNSFLDSPRLLTPTFRFRGREDLYFAGQLTGVEGYTESAASGILAGQNLARQLLGQAPLVLPRDTMLGALCAYISDPNVKEFQPMGANMGILPPWPDRIRDKSQRYMLVAQRAVDSLRAYLQEETPLYGKGDN